MSGIFDLLLHLDENLQDLISTYPIFTYLLTGLIIFMESAFFPLAPFLPGDGLLFAVGILAAEGHFDLGGSILILATGGVLGNWVAFMLGKKYGVRLFAKVFKVNADHLEKAEVFYKRHGNKAFLFSRFIPVVRALVPFIAGIAGMERPVFWKNNVLSVTFWVLSITLTSFYLGHLPFIKNNFLFILLGASCLTIISLISVGLYRYYKSHV